MLSTKKLFTLMMCLLLLPQSITAMKRKTTGRTPGGSKRSRLDNQLSIETLSAKEKPTCPWLPQELWTSISLADLSNLKTLRQTSSHVNSALSVITLDYLDTTITEHPEKAKGVAQNFYMCTKLLYRFGVQRNKEKFNILWNSQSVNDKDIRTHFADRITANITERSVTPLQVFNVLDNAYHGTKPDFSNAYYYDSQNVIDYLYEALNQKHLLSVYLATSFAFYGKIPLNYSYTLYDKFRSKPIVFLFEACKHSTVECLHILLDHGADPGMTFPDEKRNLLHLILGLFTDNGKVLYIEKRAEKLKLILQYYKKMHPQKNRVINSRSSWGTPLSYAIDLFAAQRTTLDELISIIKILLKYGADPKIHIFNHRKDGYQKGNNYTVFDKISDYKNGKIIGSITQEEGEIIIDCLNGNQ